MAMLLVRRKFFRFIIEKGLGKRITFKCTVINHFIIACLAETKRSHHVNFNLLNFNQIRNH